MIPKVWLSALLATLLAAPQVLAQQGGSHADFVDATTRFTFKFLRQTLRHQRAVTRVSVRGYKRE